MKLKPLSPGFGLEATGVDLVAAAVEGGVREARARVLRGPGAGDPRPEAHGRGSSSRSRAGSGRPSRT